MVAAASIKVESGNLQYFLKLKEEPCHTAEPSSILKVCY